MTEELKKQISEVFDIMDDEELFRAWHQIAISIGNPDGMAVYRKEKLNCVLIGWNPEDIVHIVERSESYDSNDAFFSFFGFNRNLHFH